MNISNVNLNLLVALNALLDEQNVTRAAEKLFITQSAMSNILKQLRELFQDELLVKKGRQMILSQRAEALHPHIKQLMTQIENVLHNKPFDPTTSTRTFILGMDEYAATILLPTLYTYLQTHAPHIQIQVKNIPLFSEQSMLDEKEIELAIGVLHHSKKMNSIDHDILFQEKLVCIGKPNHPLFTKKISLKHYLSANHISFMPITKTDPHVVDFTLAQMGYQRHVALRISHIMPAIYTLEKTDLIATVPLSLAREVENILHFSVQDCPIDFPMSSLAQMWHPWTLSDNACRWLRDTIKTITQNL